MIDPLRFMPESAKNAVDGLSIVATVGTLVQWLPALTSILTFIWTVIRVYELETVQKLLFGPKEGGDRGER